MLSSSTLAAARCWRATAADAALDVAAWLIRAVFDAHADSKNVRTMAAR